MMRYVIVFIIVYLGLGLAIINSQETPSMAWEVISMSNADKIISAFEFQLETPADLSNSSVYIDNLAIIPNTSYIFVSYKDRDTRQRFSPIWQIWDIETQQLVFSENSLVGTIAFSSDGQFFAFRETPQNADTRLCLWQVIDFTRLNCWDSGSILVNSFHPTDGLFFFYQPVENDTIYQLIIWDIFSNQEQYIINDVIEWNFYPLNPYQIATYNINTIALWDIENGLNEFFSYQISDEVLVSNITFDTSGSNMFFMTFSFVDSAEYLNRLNLESSEIATKQGEVTQSGIFYNPSVITFPFVSENSFMVDWVDGLTYQLVGSMARGSILDNNLNQGLLIVTSNEEPLDSDTFTVQDLRTTEIYATLLYVVDGVRYQDVRFTQDERFIIAYTEDGLVQLWGVPAEG